MGERKERRRAMFFSRGERRQGFLETGETKERRRIPKKEIRVSREKKEEALGRELHRSKSFNDFLYLHHRNSMWKPSNAYIFFLVTV